MTKIFQKRNQVCQDYNAKSCIYLMVCGSAVGRFLPPHVVYKTQNLYESWTEGGPVGAAYSVSKSGWFDMFI